jgi:hypothetical protein
MRVQCFLVHFQVKLLLKVQTEQLEIELLACRFYLILMFAGKAGANLIVPHTLRARAKQIKT